MVYTIYTCFYRPQNDKSAFLLLETMLYQMNSELPFIFFLWCPALRSLWTWCCSSYMGLWALNVHIHGTYLTMWWTRIVKQWNCLVSTWHIDVHSTTELYIIVYVESCSYKLLLCLCNHSDLPMEVRMFQPMPCLTGAEDVYSFSTALSALAVAGQWQLAVGLVEGMPQACSPKMRTTPWLHQ